MEASLREQTHQLIDELTQQQLLTLRMFLDDMQRSQNERSAPQASSSPPAPTKRISIAEYRRAMGRVEPD